MPCLKPTKYKTFPWPLHLPTIVPFLYFFSHTHKTMIMNCFYSHLHFLTFYSLFNLLHPIMFSPYLLLRLSRTSHDAIFDDHKATCLIGSIAHKWVLTSWNCSLFLHLFWYMTHLISVLIFFYFTFLYHSS